MGLGAKRIRELFEAAKQKSPAIIFIDEIDAVGGSRKLKDQSALKQTLNELLVQMDGFEENSGEWFHTRLLLQRELMSDVRLLHMAFDSIRLYFVQGSSLSEPQTLPNLLTRRCYVPDDSTNT